MIWKRARNILLAAFIVLNALSGPAPAGTSQEITVSAAISLKNSFEEIGKAYASLHPGVQVIFNFGASGDLKAQIRGGAPVNVFASAALRDMDELDNDGFLLTASKVAFASNEIVLIVPAGAERALSSFGDLARQEVKRIAVGNFRTVPAGRYAAEVFHFTNSAEAIRDKLVFAENVRQVLDYVARGEVDAGAVYATDAKFRQGDVTVAATAPVGSHQLIAYPIGVVRGTKHESAARDFIRFVTSAVGRKILASHGFKPAI